MFDHLIGQNSVKKKLSFYKRVHDKKSRCPFFLFTGAAGVGKTEFAQTFARNLKNKDGSQRKAIEVNCGSIRNVDSFFDSLYMNRLRDKEITVFFDEVHALKEDITNVFLTIFNTGTQTKRVYNHKDAPYEFNFLKQTFFFATTETHKIFKPLKDRLDPVSFEEYSPEELGQIIQKKCEEIEFSDNAIKFLTQASRGNPRSSTILSQKIIDFCDTQDTDKFEDDDLKLFCDVNGVMPSGIMNDELQILKALRGGPKSLNELQSITGLSRTAIQKDFESYLLKNEWMKIEGKRELTIKGIMFLEENFT